MEQIIHFQRHGDIEKDLEAKMQNKYYKNILIILTLVVILASISGCKPKAVQLTDADNNKEIPLEAGSQLIITLPIPLRQR